MDLHVALNAALTARGLSQADLRRRWGELFGAEEEPADTAISSYVTGARQPSAPRLRQFTAVLADFAPLTEGELSDIAVDKGGC